MHQNRCAHAVQSRPHDSFLLPRLCPAHRRQSLPSTAESINSRPLGPPLARSLYAGSLRVERQRRHLLNARHGRLAHACTRAASSRTRTFDRPALLTKLQVYMHTYY